jgi:hypothetical protein
LPGEAQAVGPRPLRVALTGSGGFIGRALAQTLVSAGRRVIRLVRRPALGPDEIFWRPGNSSPLRELDGVDALIHLAGENIAASRWTPETRRRIEDSRSTATRALAESLAALAHPPAVALCASAIGIYGTRTDDPLGENAPPGDGFLSGVCRRWEAACDPLRERGTRVVSLRFGAVLDPSGGMLARLLPVYRLGLGGPLGTGRQSLSWISLSDALGAIRFLLDTPDLSGPVNVVSPGGVTQSEFNRALGLALHRPAFLRVPGFALRLLLGDLAREVLLGGARVAPTVLLRAGFAFRHPSLDACLREALAPAETERRDPDAREGKP